jgi:DNA adenine methylase
MESVRQEITPPQYIEPFLGGAAIFLNSPWTNPYLADANETLIRCYKGIAQDPGLVRRKLARLPVDRATFDAVKVSRPSSNTGVAARLLYLNRTAFGGIYRVNSQGHFNVPFSGDRSLAPILKFGILEGISTALRSAIVECCDYTLALDRAIPGALVFCDPPYSLAGGEAAFRRYTQNPFDWNSQERLAARLNELTWAGTVVIVTNSYHSSVRNLYTDAQVLPLARQSNFRSFVGAGSSRDEAIYVLARDKSIQDAVRKRIVEELSL